MEVGKGADTESVNVSLPKQHRYGPITLGHCLPSCGQDQLGNLDVISAKIQPLTENMHNTEGNNNIYKYTHKVKIEQNFGA